MKVALLQMDLKWCDGEMNRHNAEVRIKESSGADMYVLPEMFSTGFATQPNGVAEQEYDGICDTLKWMLRVAKETDAAIAGSVAVETSDGSFRNRFFFVKPDGNYVFYDKRHLFTYGHEDDHYTAGDERVIVEWRGMKILLQVCYDLRFPCFSRNAMVHESAMYDCCIYVASWPKSRRKVWDALLLARALENQCFVIGVNRVGDDTLCHYNGGTKVLDAYGKELSAAADDKIEMITADLDMERLQAFREKFPVLRDADNSK